MTLSGPPLSLRAARLATHVARRSSLASQRRALRDLHWQHGVSEGTSEPDKDSGYDHLPDSAGYYFFARFSRRPVFRTNVGHMTR
jgi:hypothetical protein